MHPHRPFSAVPGSFKKAQATLSLTILVGGTAILVGLTLAFLTLSFINITAGIQASSRALTVASAGAQDALLQLIRNKDFSSGGYQVSIGNDTATVSVTNTVSVNQLAEIVSAATIFKSQRKIKVVASVDSQNGKVSVVSWEQLRI